MEVEFLEVSTLYIWEQFLIFSLFGANQSSMAFQEIDGGEINMKILWEFGILREMSIIPISHVHMRLNSSMMNPPVDGFSSKKKKQKQI